MVDVAVGQLTQALINANPNGTIFYLAAGVHRITAELAPKQDQQFIGASQLTTFVNGSLLLTGWVSDGAGHWYTVNEDVGGANFTFTQQAGGPSGTGRYNWLRDIFYDDTPLKHVASLGACISGTFFCDDTASPKRIYIADDPSGHTVEFGTASFAFKASVSGVVLRKMTIGKCATAAQTGAIAENGTAWTVEDCTIRLNHGVGIKVATGWTVRRCAIKNNGQLGLGSGGGTGMLIERCDFLDNGHVSYDAAGTTAEKGQFKLANTDGAIVRYCRLYNTPGAADWAGVVFEQEVKGAWFDILNINFTFTNNLVYYCGRGCDVEISPGPGVIQYNVFKYCAKGTTSSVYKSCVIVNTSGNSDNPAAPGGVIDISYNTVVTHADDGHSLAGNGVCLVEQDRTQSGYRHRQRNTHVHHNIFIHPGQSARNGIRDDYADTTDAIVLAADNIFSYNEVHGDTGGDQRHWEMGTGGGTGTWYTLANLQAAYPHQEIGSTYDNTMPAGYSTIPTWSMYQDLSITASQVLASQIAAIKTKQGVAGETVTAGQVVYYDSTSDRFRLADADVAASAVAVGVALNNASANQPVIVCIEGTLVIGAEVIKGATYVVSGAAGGITDMSTLTAGQYAFRLGVGLVDNRLMLSIADIGAVQIA